VIGEGVLGWHHWECYGAFKRQGEHLGEDAGKRTLIHCQWEGKLAQPLWKEIWRLLTKLKGDLT
jgi:hypothetical protein